jgi:tetratricopeptide (TPR) repeat protein
MLDQAARSLALILMMIVMMTGAVLPIAPAPADSHPQSESTFDQLLRDARAAEQAKDYARAEEVYRRIVNLRPHDAVPRQNLGLALYLQGRYADALPHLKKALDLDPKLFGAWLYLGISSFRVNQFSDAVQDLQKAKHLEPDNQLAQYWLGAAHLALKSFPAAIAELEIAASQPRTDLETLYLLARAHAEYSAFLLDRLLNIAPDSVAAYKLHAHDALAEGLIRSAVVALEKALALRPGDVDARQVLTELEKMTAEDGTVSGPIVVRMQLAGASKPPAEEPAEDPDALYALGKFHEARSAALGGRLFELYPNSYRARLMRGEAHEKGSPPEYERALQEYRMALSLKPDVPGIEYAIGRILWKLRRWDEAVPFLRMELQRNPNHGLAHYYLGNAYLSLDDRENAIVHLQAATRAMPDLTQAYRDLGRALAGSGQQEGAIAAFQQALEIDPEYPGVHAQMAVAFRALGRMEEAHRAAETARALSIKRNQGLR